MGIYITQDDLFSQISEEELISLTDDEELGSINTERVNACISQAEAIIDSYLGARYKLPFEVVPEVLKKIAVDMTVYFLESRRRAPTEERRQNYEDAVKFLKDIAKGIASLGISQEVDVPQENKPEITANERIFTRGSLKDF